MRPAPRSPDILPGHDVAMLCLLALRDEAAAQFLKEQNWQETLAETANTDLLAKILESDVRPADPASLNAFMVTLSPAEESLVSAWLMQKMPDDAARGWPRIGGSACAKPLCGGT